MSPYSITKLKGLYHNDTELDLMQQQGITACYYQGKRNPPDHPRRPLEPTYEHWEEFAMKLCFVFIFENVVATVTMCLRWLIPDVPTSLRQLMRQHAYLTNDLILQQETKRAKEMREGQETQQ